jgi:hypothetical protein
MRGICILVSLALSKLTSLRIIWFLDFVHLPESGITRRHGIWKLDFFPSSCERREKPAVLGPLERANLNHWTTHVL